MRERLELALAEHDAGERLRDLRVLGSPVQTVRMAFDLMARDTADDWQVVAERMALVPQGLVEHRGRAGRGRGAGHRRGAPPGGGLHQAGRHLGRASTRSTPPFFLALVDEYDASRPRRRPRSATGSRRSATRATEAYASLGRFLVEEYAPHASERDPVGPRALRAVRAGLQRHRARPRRDLRVGMGRAAPHRARDGPGRRADHPRRRRRHGDRAPRDRPGARDRGRRRVPARGTRSCWTRTVAELDGTHFDIPEPVQRVEAMIAPPGGAAAMYYTGPSEDFSRPGPHLVPDARQDPLPALGRGVDLLPRGRPRPSPADRAGALPRRLAEPLPAHARGHVGPRRGLGALRRAAHGRARLPRRPRLRARHAAGAGDARGARRRRHRHAPRARDPRPRALPPRRDVDARARAARS